MFEYTLIFNNEPERPIDVETSHSIDSGNQVFFEGDYYNVSSANGSHRLLTLVS